MTEAPRRVWAKDLDAQSLYELLKLRVEVFVVEQAIPYPELDGRDLLAETRHFWLETPEGEVICTLRLMEEHAGGQKVFRIGRLCTKRSARGQGHTTRLLRAALAEATYRREDAALRSAASTLNPARDARVLVRALDSLRRRGVALEIKDIGKAYGGRTVLEHFNLAIAAGEFVEWAEYSGNRYGTLRSELERRLEDVRHIRNG